MNNPFDQFDSAPQQAAANPFDQFDSKPEVSNVSAGNLDVPGGGQVSYAQAPEDKSIGDYAEGLAETALTLGTGATTGAAGFMAGAIPDAIDSIAGNPDQKYRESFSAALTNTPESESGRDMVGAIGETLGALPPVGLPTGSLGTALTAKAVRVPKVTETKGALKSFDNPSTVPKRFFKQAEAAAKQGFDEDMIKVATNASLVDRKAGAEMAKMVERGFDNPNYKQDTRPHDIAGKTLNREINFVKSQKDLSGKQLGRISRSLTKPIDVSLPVKDFKRSLSDIGIKLYDNGKPEFSGSLVEFSGPAKTLITNALTKINRKKSNPTGLEAHEFKKFLDEDLNHGKKSEGGISGKVEKLMGDLRRDINNSIGEVSPEYKEANKRFSDSITVLDDLQEVVGKKNADFEMKNIEQALGQALRRTTGEAATKVRMKNAIEALNKVSKEYGGDFGGDISTQMKIANELDRIFNTSGDTSAKNTMGPSAAEKAIDLGQMTGVGMLAEGAKAGVKKIRGVNKRGAMKAIKELMKDQNQNK
ncbi:MAG: hypothetical protein V3R25_06135 [Nitrosomonadaceae bacterium]